jgi:hypothetical protein
MRAISELDNGITYVNAPTIGAEAHLPFGGVKETGNGHREGGWEVYHFYSETKVAYLDFSGTLQRAQIDTYAHLRRGCDADRDATRPDAASFRHPYGRSGSRYLFEHLLAFHDASINSPL